jgi:thymidylate synthase ThyX
MDQIQRIWVVTPQEEQRVEEAISAGWRRERIELPELAYQERSWTRNTLGWMHMGSLKSSKQFRGAAVVDEDVMAMMWQVIPRVARY